MKRFFRIIFYFIVISFVVNSYSGTPGVRGRTQPMPQPTPPIWLSTTFNDLVWPQVLTELTNWIAHETAQLKQPGENHRSWQVIKTDPFYNNFWNHTSPEIGFYTSGAPYYEFTNLYGLTPWIKIKDRHGGIRDYPTSEHYFQAQKCTDPANYDNLLSGRVVVSVAAQGYNEIGQPFLSLTGRPIQLAGTAQSRGGFGLIPNFDTNWNNISVWVMLVALWAKFNQHQNSNNLLLNPTDNNKPLFEDADVDAFWGVGDDKTGCNWLGRLLMLVRYNLLHGTPVPLPRRIPKPIPTHTTLPASTPITSTPPIGEILTTADVEAIGSNGQTYLDFLKSPQAQVYVGGGGVQDLIASLNIGISIGDVVPYRDSISELIKLGIIKELLKSKKPLTPEKFVQLKTSLQELKAKLGALSGRLRHLKP